ncbi:MAG: VCBS repeat-containing protein [Planctomycetaceae bacterium]
MLRNDGQLSFEPKHIAAMPGVLRAVTADLDGDGDQDIIAAALLPLKSVRGKTPAELQALIWLEQTSDGQFARHVIQRGLPIYASLAVSDIDGDSDLDIVAGCFHAEPADPPSLLHVFENREFIDK